MNISSHCLLACKVSTGKSADSFTEYPLYMKTFSLTALKILTLFFIFESLLYYVLVNISLSEDLFLKISLSWVCLRTFEIDDGCPYLSPDLGIFKHYFFKISFLILSSSPDEGTTLMSIFALIICCSVTQSCLTLYDPMDCSTPGVPVLHHLPEFAQTHVHWVGDTIQPTHPLLSPSPPVFNPYQH